MIREPYILISVILFISHNLYADDLPTIPDIKENNLISNILIDMANEFRNAASEDNNSLREYIVVYPETIFINKDNSYNDLISTYYSDLYELKKFIPDDNNCKLKGSNNCNVIMDKLIKKLFSINTNRYLLNIDPLINKHYKIDYKGEFNDEWEIICNTHPEILLKVNISRPAFDLDSGLLMFYTEYSHPFEGDCIQPYFYGVVWLAIYENDKTSVIASYMIWQS